MGSRVRLNFQKTVRAGLCKLGVETGARLQGIQAGLLERTGEDPHVESDVACQESYV